MAPEINNRAVIACGAIPYFIRAISHNLGGNYREYVIYHSAPAEAVTAGGKGGRTRWLADFFPLLESNGMGDRNEDHCGIYIVRMSLPQENESTPKIFVSVPYSGRRFFSFSLTFG